MPEQPASFELPRLQEKPRDKRLANLRFGPGIGRRKGSTDKITRDLKEGIIEGAVQAGFDGEGLGGLVGYCKWLAMFHPKAYAHLLVKLLPYNLHATASGQSISTMNIVSVESGKFLSRDEIARLESGEFLSRDETDRPQQQPLTLNHLPTTEEPSPVEAPIAQSELSVPVQEIERSPEEEQQLINKLTAEIHELAQKAGISLVV